MKNFQKVAALLLAGCVVLAAAGAQEGIGLTVGVDGFELGNMAGDDYKFKEEANITPFVQYNKDGIAGNLDLEIWGSGTIHFTSTKDPSFDFYVQGIYNLALGDSSALAFRLRPDVAIDMADGKGNPALTIIPGVKFTQTLGFGSIYFNVDLSAAILNADNTKKTIAIGIGGADNLRIGVDANSGTYGYVEIPSIALYKANDGTSATFDDSNPRLSDLNIRLGQTLLDDNLDIRATFGLPIFVTDGIKTNGITIEPCVTYSNIVPGLAAYLNIALGNLGTDEDLSVTPTIGVSYSF